MHHEKGLGYKPSETGLKVLLVLTVGFGRILAVIEGQDGGMHDE